MSGPCELASPGETGGDPGTVVLTVYGNDKYGGYNETQLSLTLR